MPNHVEHDMVVSGPADQLSEFEKFAYESPDVLSANKFIPYPKKFADADAERRRLEKEVGFSEAMKVKDGFNSGGYDWCVENWGTKWGIYAGSIDPREDEGEPLTYHFQTAWAPPTPVLVAMTKRFPTLHFDVRYFERGAAFQGHLQLRGGKKLHDTQTPYYGRRGG